MKAIIYVLSDEPDFAAFDRAVPSALTGSTWDEWEPVAMVEGTMAIIKGGDQSWTMHVGGQEYSAQAVLAGEASGWPGIRLTWLIGKPDDGAC